MDYLIQNEIFLGVLTFTLTVNFMVLIILGATKIMVSSGNIDIEINEDVERTLRVQTGGKLLQALASKNLFLSSACGGKGTCSQ